jgi:hypothetical protein
VLVITLKSVNMALIMSSALISRLFFLSKGLGWPLLGEGRLLGILRYGKVKLVKIEFIKIFFSLQKNRSRKHLRKKVKDFFLFCCASFILNVAQCIINS